MSGRNFTTTNSRPIKNDRANLSNSDVVAQFCDAMRVAGLIVEASDIITDSPKFQRCKTDRDKGARKNGYYKLWTDGRPAGVFGIWSTGQSHTWSADTGAEPMSAEEQARLRAEMKRKQAERAAKLKEARNKAAEKAKRQWDKAVQADDSHPYLQRKGVKAHGLRVGVFWGWNAEAGEYYKRCENALIVPMITRKDGKPDLRSVQYIFPKELDFYGDRRDKTFIKDGERPGMFHVIGKPLEVDGRKVVVVAEGYATAASLHECTGHCVLVAFTRDNLLHTAKVFREKYADAIIIIAADNDQFTVAPVRNPGVVDAHKAAHAVGGLVAVPEFTDLSDERDDEGRLIDRPTDFNDAHQRPGYGEEFVRATINALLYPQVEDVSVPEVGDDTLTWAGEPQFPAEAAEVPRASTSRTQDDAADEAARELEVKLGFSVLGYIGETIYLMSHEKQQIIARDSFPPATLVQLADIQWWEMHFPGKSGPNANAAANFIIRTAHRRGFFDQDRRRKPGAWEDAGRHVFHHGDHLTVDGARVELHQIKSRYVYERDVALPAPSGTPMTDAEGQAIYDIAKRFSWEQTSSAALLVGWTFLAPLCGLLPWRPHIHPTGVAGNGKSSILNKLIKPLLGEKRGAILADGSSSAPGLRQRLKSRSMPVLMDEAEGNDEQARQNMGNMYALGRAMSSGDGFEIIKGSATHESHSFESRAMFCMAAINPSMENKADLDRFTQLTLRKSRGDKDAAAKWEQTRAMLHAIERDDGIAGRMVGRLVGMTREILANVAVFTKAAAAKFGNQRDGDQLGTMAAGCWCLTRSDVATEDQARAFLDHLDWTAQAEQDEIDDTQNALNHLMQTLIRVDGRELAMRELMEIALGGKVDGSDVRAPRARAELCRHGIAINATGVDASMFALSNSSKALKALLEGTQAGNNPGRAFANLAGAIKTSRDDKVKFGGGPTQAVLVPLKLIGLDHVQRLADEVGAVRIGYEDSRHLSAEEEEGYAISQGMFGGMPSSTRRQ